MQCKGCAETGAGCCSDGHPRRHSPLIYILLDAAAIRQLIPERAWSVALPVYYLAAAAFVLLAIRGFFRRNQEQYRRFSAVQAA